MSASNEPPRDTEHPDEGATRKLASESTFSWFVLAGFVLVAVLLTLRLWLGGRHVSLSVPGLQDQNLFEWFFAHAARCVTHLENPLISDRLNVPDKINIIANTSMIGLGIVLAPVTLLFGPHVTYATVLVLGLAGTAFGWYWLLGKAGVRSPWAAVVGGALCGFGPGMMSHAGAHPNFVAQFLVPLIVYRVIALTHSGSILVKAVWLALAIVAQFFVGEEVLFMTAVSCAVFFGCHAVIHRVTVRTLLPRFALGLAIAGALTAVLIAYPVYVQFYGPASYRGIFEGANWAGSDLAAVFTYPTASLGGDAGRIKAFFTSHVEENTFYSWPLVLFVVLGSAWRWHDKRVKVLAISALIVVVFALGPQLRFRGEETKILLPLRLLVELPIFRVAIPARFGLAGLSLLGALVAFIVDAILAEPRAVRLGWLAATSLALVPLIPTPLTVAPREPVPAFFAHEDIWQRYVKPGQSIVPVPLPNWDVDSMHWAAEAQLGFSLPRGYFHGPGGVDGTSQMTPPCRYLCQLLDGVRMTRNVPTITDENREAAMADLRYWRAGVVALYPSPAEQELRTVLVQLLGEPIASHGVLLWDLP